MTGHTSSITLVMDMLKERMSGDDMMTHAPKWLRDSVRLASFPTSSICGGAEGTVVKRKRVEPNGALESMGESADRAHLDGRGNGA